MNCEVHLAMNKRLDVRTVNSELADKKGLGKIDIIFFKSHLQVNKNCLTTITKKSRKPSILYFLELKLYVSTLPLEEDPDSEISSSLMR